MIEKIKESLIVKNIQLKAQVNTLKAHNEFLMDKRIDDLLKALGRSDDIEKKDREILILTAKNQSLKEVIKELKNGKTHK